MWTMVGLIIIAFALIFNFMRIQATFETQFSTNNRIKYIASNGLYCDLDKCNLEGKISATCQTKQTSSFEPVESPCSLMTNVDSNGRPCRSDHPCGFHGEEYLWCYIDIANNWNFCGLVQDDIDDSEKRLTASGWTCKSICTQRNLAEAECYEYSFVDFDNGAVVHIWEYCSRTNQSTSSGIPCNSGHDCDFHGENYQWCYVGDSWDFCGKVYKDDAELAFKTYFTRYGHGCESFCFDSGVGYYWCRSIGLVQNGWWEYCSRNPHETVRGQRCKEGSLCETHGQNYNWCYTGDDGSWDYCSKVELKHSTEESKILAMTLTEKYVDTTRL